MAREPGGEERSQLRHRIDFEWNKANRQPPKRRRSRPTQREKGSAVDSAVVDLIDWLAENPKVTDQIESIANVIDKQVVEELDRSFDAEERTRRRKELTDHFWCDLLAALAVALKDLQDQVDMIPDRIADLVIAARQASGRNEPISEHQVRMVAKQAWGLFKKLPFVAAALPSVEEPLRAVRILAVMICPAPENHEEVAKHCLHPLVGEYISTITKQRLKEALPDYFPS